MVLYQLQADWKCAESSSSYSEAAVIRLTNGKLVIVDQQDYLWLRGWKWMFKRNSRTNEDYGYAYRTARVGEGLSKKQVLMHRLIAQTPSNLVCDHINGDPFDNRRANLRNITQSQNLMNRGVFASSRSGKKGVVFDKKVEKWRVQIVRYFNSQEEAEDTYRRLSEVSHGEFQRGSHLANAPRPLTEPEKVALWESQQASKRADKEQLDRFL